MGRSESRMGAHTFHGHIGLWIVVCSYKSKELGGMRIDVYNGLHRVEINASRSFTPDSSTRRASDLI